MKSVTTSEHLSLESWYKEGYRKGYWDARRGIHAKLMSHVLELRSDAMRQWDDGYLRGYQEGLSQQKR